MSKREGGAVVNLRIFVPVEKNSTRSQIAVSTAILDLEEGNGVAKLLALPGIDVLKVDHRYTTREAAAEPAPAEQAASAGQAGTVTVAETAGDPIPEGQPVPAETQDTASAAGAQADAIDEAATGQRKKRA